MYAQTKSIDIAYQNSNIKLSKITTKIIQFAPQDHILNTYM